MANDNNAKSGKRHSNMENKAKKLKITESSLHEVPNQPDQLVTFSKYGLSASELRHHVLTYLFPKTLKKYAVVSSLCNEEVQKFNTWAPRMFEYTKTEDAVEIKLQYKKSTISKTFASENDAKKIEIVRWIEKKYQCVKIHATHRISIDSREWPDYILEMGYFNQVSHLFVIYRRDLTTRIMDYIRRWPLTKLELLKPKMANPANEEIVPRIFFEGTTLHKITRKLLIEPRCDIDREQFMALEPSYLNIALLEFTKELIDAKHAKCSSGTSKCVAFSIDSYFPQMEQVRRRRP